MNSFTWTTETLFNRERFEAWLASQPGERGFDFRSNTHCLICAFIKETSSYPLFLAGGETVGDGKENILIPMWLRELLHQRDKYTFTISQMRTAYQKLYGVDLTPQPEPVEQKQPVKI